MICFRCQRSFCSFNTVPFITLVKRFHQHVKLKQFIRLVPKIKDTGESARPLSHPQLKQLLKNCKSVPEQITVLSSYTKLKEDSIRHRQNVCQDIESIFKAYFPDSSVQLLGSSANGLGMEGCDTDLSFQWTREDSSKGDAEERDIVLTRDVEEGNVSPSKFLLLRPKQKLRFLDRILKEAGIGGPSVIIPGKCPILNFTHRNLVCELSIDNHLAARTTSLVRLLAAADSRIPPLYGTVSFWAKCCRLSGDPMNFKSYALFLLLVHFLQATSPPSLPPIQYILDETDYLKNTDTWKFDSSTFTHKTENIQTTEELLRHFFFFYSNFEFSNVICTLSGSYPSEVDAAFERNTISVRDPLDPARNVTAGVTWRNSKKFKRCILRACNALQSSSDGSFGLVALFDIPDGNSKRSE